MWPLIPNFQPDKNPGECKIVIGLTILVAVVMVGILAYKIFKSCYQETDTENQSGNANSKKVKGSRSFTLHRD